MSYSLGSAVSRLASFLNSTCWQEVASRSAGLHHSRFKSSRKPSLPRRGSSHAQGLALIACGWNSGPVLTVQDSVCEEPSPTVLRSPWAQHLLCFREPQRLPRLAGGTRNSQPLGQAASFSPGDTALHFTLTGCSCPSPPMTSRYPLMADHKGPGTSSPIKVPYPLQTRRFYRAFLPPGHL